VRIGDVVAVFAQGPIGLCATAGARLKGASRIFAIESVPERRAISLALGAEIVIDQTTEDPIEVIMRLTGGRGVDVAIEALGTQETFELCLKALRPGGTLSSLGVYSGKLTMPVEAFHAGLGDISIVSTLCPGGKERMRRLLSVVAAKALDLRPLVTHRFNLDQITEAYDLFAHQRDGVIKVAITI
jgi:threonine dehydrogenase-like Zn-dependent dehydrogenase